jgi:hypothetical protein
MKGKRRNDFLVADGSVRWWSGARRAGVGGRAVAHLAYVSIYAGA